MKVKQVEKLLLLSSDALKIHSKSSNRKQKLKRSKDLKVRTDLAGDPLHHHSGHWSYSSAFWVVKRALGMIQTRKRTNLLLRNCLLVRRLKKNDRISEQHHFKHFLYNNNKSYFIYSLSLKLQEIKMFYFISNPDHQQVAESS